MEQITFGGCGHVDDLYLPTAHKPSEIRRNEKQRAFKIEKGYCPKCADLRREKREEPFKNLYKIEPLAKCDFRSEEFEASTRESAMTTATQIVTKWRKLGYRGGAQLLTYGFKKPFGAMIQVFGRE